MEAIHQFIHAVVPEGFDFHPYWTAILPVIIILGLGFIGRIFLGKKSTLCHTLSSTISILFIYIVTVVVYSLGIDLAFLISPLPFIGIADGYMSVFIFEGTRYTVICDQILSMIILSFLANIADNWLPTGKNLFSWFFFRCLSVLLAMILHLITKSVISAVLPEGLLTWAPVVLLSLLGILIAVGYLRILIGTILSVAVHPLFGIIYTFFFANVVGKQISKAVITTGLLTGLVFLLDYLGTTIIPIAAPALIAYIPLLLILLIVWFIIGRLL